MGRGVGAILSGIFINRFGTRAVFAAYGILSALVLAGFVYINTQRTGTGFEWFQDEGDHNVNIDESTGGLAPHGVPSAPIRKTLSKSNFTKLPENLACSNELPSLQANLSKPVDT